MPAACSPASSCRVRPSSSTASRGRAHLQRRGADPVESSSEPGEPQLSKERRHRLLVEELRRGGIERAARTAMMASSAPRRAPRSRGRAARLENDRGRRARRDSASGVASLVAPRRLFAKAISGRLHVLGHKVIPKSGLSNGPRCALQVAGVERVEVPVRRRPACSRRQVQAAPTSCRRRTHSSKRASAHEKMGSMIRHAPPPQPK